MIEEIARVPVEVEFASEFRYYDPIVDADSAVLAITQSGETADTLAACELARESGAVMWSRCRTTIQPAIATITARTWMN